MDTRFLIGRLLGLLQQPDVRPSDPPFSSQITGRKTRNQDLSCQIYNIIRAPMDTDTAESITNARTSPPLPLAMVEDAP
jgi:hypothetical protein